MFQSHTASPEEIILFLIHSFPITLLKLQRNERVCIPHLHFLLGYFSLSMHFYFLWKHTPLKYDIKKSNGFIASQTQI